MVDLGSGTMDICIFIDGALAYSSVLPIGSRNITNDLAIGLRISLESAEKIKLLLNQKTTQASQDHQVLTPVETPLPKKDRHKDESADDIDLSSLNLSEGVSKVSKKTLIDGIIKPRLNEIFTMVGLEIKKSGFVEKLLQH